MSLKGLLTKDELIQLLGTDDPVKQKRKLRENGIRFITGVKGHFSVPWYNVVNSPANKAPANNNNNEPNWDAM